MKRNARARAVIWTVAIFAMLALADAAAAERLELTLHEAGPGAGAYRAESIFNGMAANRWTGTIEFAE